MNLDLHNRLLGTEGEFYWYTPNWLNKLVCKIAKSHKIDTEFGSMHCYSCNLCLYEFEDLALKHLLCPDCQMNSSQLEIWMNCDNDDCLQECINNEWQL